MLSLRRLLKTVLGYTHSTYTPARPARRPNLEQLETRTLLSSGLDLASVGPKPILDSNPALLQPVVAQSIEIPLSQTRQAAPSTPTGASLGWGDFRTLSSSPNGYDAETTWNTQRGSYKIKVTSNSYKVKGKWKTCAVARIEGDVSVTARFDASRSWVVNGKQSDALLRHEALHLQIAEHIAAQAKTNLMGLFGYGYVTHANKAKSKALAEKKAIDDLKRKIAEWDRQWAQLERQATHNYDTATNHSQNAANQANWEANWQNHVNAVIQNTWH